jgi:hypothetical protein
MTDENAAASAASAASSATQAGVSAKQAEASATVAALSVSGGAPDSGKYHHKKEAYLARYAEHNARLQTWIGGYGAGLASLLVYQFRTAISDAKELWRSHGGTDTAAAPVIKLTNMHAELACALTLIAIALALQVVLLYLNKATQFAITHSDEEEANWSRWEGISEWFSGFYWFDAVCDAVSIGLLGLATYEGIRALGLVP